MLFAGTEDRPLNCWQCLMSLAWLLSAACSINATPPLGPAAAACRTDAAVVGRWSVHGLTQLGPARSTITFECDCVMSTSTLLLWGHLKGRQRYHVEGDTLVIEGLKSSSRVPFLRTEDHLELSWPAGERQRLTMSRPLQCPAPGGG